MIYACTQKNLGTAGLTIMVVRDDLIGNQRKECPAIFDFKVGAQNLRIEGKKLSLADVRIVRYANFLLFFSL